MQQFFPTIKLKFRPKNMRHAQFQVWMQKFWIILVFCVNFKVSCNFWRTSRCSHVAKIAQRLKDKVPKKQFFTHNFLDFYLIFSLKNTYGSVWCNLQCDCFNVEAFDLFWENLQVLQCQSFWHRPPFTKTILAHSYLDIWDWELSQIWPILIKKSPPKIEKIPK